VRPKRQKLFPKPTAFAILAALIGLAIHAAVFFLVQIRVQEPGEVSHAQEGLVYLGNSDPESVALIDPLTLLVTSGTKRPGPQLDDFRALSISREISSFPPFYKIENNRNWDSWIQRPNREDNPGSWLLEHSESSLQSFGQEEIPDLQLTSDTTTLRIQNLTTGEVSYRSFLLPPEIQAVAVDIPFLAPASFILDRTNPLIRPSALLVESSGDAAVDRAMARALAESLSENALFSGYTMVTYYLAPIDPSQNP
tara:strand:- start:22628 stop:23386 length:759 start_codon:yes stop_codon:yes gene_type:complete